MTSPYPRFRETAAGRPRRERDLTWGRIVFHAPALPNPRVVFDPLPFRTQNFAALFRAKPAGR